MCRALPVQRRLSTALAVTPVQRQFPLLRHSYLVPYTKCLPAAYTYWHEAPRMTFADARKIALSLPNVVESTSYGTAAFKASGKLVARLKEDGDSLVVGTTIEERAEMIAADPETYYITDHYLNYPWVLVRLSRVHPDALRDLLRRALRLASAKAQPRRRAVRSRRSSE